jgi:putative hydrolase of the HAD superfamily
LIETFNNNIQAIIFDLGNVLVDFDHSIAAKRIAHFCKKTPQEIFNLFFDSQITGLFEEGKIGPRDFFLKVKEMLELNLSYDTFVPIWNDIFFLSAKNRAVYSLANSLKVRYKTALLSNINTLHYEYLKKRFPVFNVFHHVFASCELGSIKPNRIIYKKVLEILEVSPKNIFYTDDRTELVESAKDLGIKSFVFRNVTQLKKDLRGSGIEIN